MADQPVRMIVDTGLKGVVMYAHRLTNQGIPYRVEGQTIGASLEGQVRWKRAIVPPLRVGRRAIDREVILADSPGEKFLPGIQGFFGTSAIKAHRIHFDFEKHTLSWTD